MKVQGGKTVRSSDSKLASIHAWRRLTDVGLTRSGALCTPSRETLPILLPRKLDTQSCATVLERHFTFDEGFVGVFANRG